MERVPIIGGARVVFLAAAMSIMIAVSSAAAPAAASGAAATPVVTVEANPPGVLGGRLGGIKQARSVRIGYREHAIPFSWAGPDGRPIGYSIELCSAVVTRLAEELGVPLSVEYVAVTAQDRLAKAGAGLIDLECGSTTNTAERRREVSFSPTIFITGARLAVPRNHPRDALREIPDLAGRSIAVVAGTTTEAAMRELDRKRKLAMRFVLADDYPAALARVKAGDADALAADEALLLGLLLETGQQDEFRLVGPRLSFETYGIVIAPGDRRLAELVDATLRQLARSREIVWVYNRWFVRPLPGRGALGLPMSQELHRAFELIGLPPE